MKKLVTLLLALVMLMGLVSGVTAAEEPAVGGQIVYATSSEISGDWAHSAIWTNNATDNTIRGLMNDYATIAFDQGGAMVENKSVVESLEQVVNDDGTKTFTIKIYDDLLFSDGSPITAKHYVASVALFSHPTLIALGSKSVGYEYYVGGIEFKDGVTENYPGVRLIDDYTFSLTVVEEYIPYYYDLSYASVMPLSIAMWLGEGYDIVDDGEGVYFTGDMSVEALTEKIETARFLSEGRVTAGPYKLVSYDTAAKQAVLEINEYYKGNFEGQKPHVQKLVIARAEDATQFDALQTGQFDLISSLTGGEDVNKALDLVDAGGFQTVEFERNGYGKLMFQSDFGPTQFINVRHAVAHLLDRPEFANTFTGGYGGLVHGPYGLSMWMYQESQEELDEKLNPYPYSLADAEALLVEDGWVLDAEGNDYVEGVRYKKVTEEEAGQYEHNVTLADGTILMPLIIEWASTEDNPVSELLVTMLAENPDAIAAGFDIRQTTMTFPELLNWMYRDKTVDEAYGVPKYDLFNLATNFTPIYDMSFSFTSDPEKVALGTNDTRLFNDEIDKLTMDMVYGVNSDEPEKFRELWVQYIDLWNELLPELPLYSNIYYTIFNDKLQGYTETPIWSFEQAIVYSWVEE